MKPLMHAVWLYGFALALAGLCVHGCGGKTLSHGGDGTDSSTHWLQACSTDRDCGSELSCVCAVCTLPCEENDACRELDAEATCLAAVESCESPQAAKSCTLECSRAADCPGENVSCSDGRCVVGLPEAPDSGVNPPGGRSCAAMDASSSGDDCDEIDGYAWTGEACEAIICGCGGADCSSLYTDENACLEAHLGCSSSAPYGVCNNASDCEPDEDCFAGTCAENCSDSDECVLPADIDRRCFVPEEPGCLVAVVEPGTTTGQCLPRCQTDADCHRIAPGLSCWASACVRQLPACETACPKVATSCGEACDPILARAFYMDKMCRDEQPQVLGCVPEGRSSTDDDNCLKDPNGAILVGLSGTYARQLFLEGEYQECTDEELEIAGNNQQICE